MKITRLTTWLYLLTSQLRHDISFIIFSLTILIAIFIATHRTVENYHLQTDIMSLRVKVRELSGELAGAPSLQKGDVLPSFRARNLHGELKNLSYERSAHSLLFLFSVECSACEKQLPLWKQLGRERSKWNYQVIGVAVNSSDTVRRQLQQKDIDFEVLVPNDFAIQRAFRTVNLPLTVIASREGRVEWLSYGVLTSTEVREISARLKNDE